jgi:hypothetical protein
MDTIKNEERKKKISNSMKGKSKPKEYSERMSLRNKINNPMSHLATIEKMRETKLRKFKDGTFKPFMLNKHHSKQTKGKISKFQEEKWDGKRLSKEEKRIRENARNMAEKNVPLKDNCEICNSTEKLQRHHWRYDKPLLVNTICSYCHDVQHGRIIA